MMTDKILRLPELQNRLGISRSSIYSAVSAGQFPKPIRLGQRAVGWSSDEIDAWMDRRKALREIDQ